MEYQVETIQQPVPIDPNTAILIANGDLRLSANHIQVANAPSADKANKALAAKAAMFAEMGIQVHLCGENLKSTIYSI
jgi:hypothetical protein